MDATVLFSRALLAAQVAIHGATSQYKEALRRFLDHPLRFSPPMLALKDKNGKEFLVIQQTSRNYYPVGPSEESPLDWGFRPNSKGVEDQSKEGDEVREYCGASHNLRVGDVIITSLVFRAADFESLEAAFKKVEIMFYDGEQI